MADSIPRIVLTPGEPAGIGPDLVLQLAQSDYPVELVAVADREMLRRRATALGLTIELENYLPAETPGAHRPTVLKVLHVPLAQKEVAGELNPANAAYVLQTLDVAVAGCQSGEFSALVTGPVHKGVINDAGVSFSGHTEYLAAHTGGHPVMMLATEGLRVALATTHLPLSDVAAAITADVLHQVLDNLHHDLIHRFGIASPRILVCGLNPHAGEGGHLGHEEMDTIIPVLEHYRNRGWDVIGPLPADTLFTPERLESADAVLAMYHDQGLPVLKYKGFGAAVNITLGLPIIRTSVDHGTALDLAASGRAKANSFCYALKVAISMVENQ